uniref:Glycosyltransferase family 92 protein n=1 Tax=Plectus sambesii TaxID=2011161 RepID=A0A914WBW2_9BILA
MSAVFGNCHIKACKYDGMYAEFEFPTPITGNQVFLDVVDVNNQSSSAVITVRRSVEPSKRKHRLAVCLPALFYYSDTVQLIEFMENWLLAGATKFYVYWQAITPAIKKKGGVDLEMVAFPPLNNRTLDMLMYYTGQLVTINDCLHRARSEAEFATICDLDELMVTNPKNLSTLLSITKLKSAGWYLARTHAHFEKEPDYSSDAQKLSFAPLGQKMYAAALFIGSQTPSRRKKAFPV